MSLSAIHLSHDFGKQRVLRDVDFSLGRGEICALLGPNGAGKSTLLRILTGSLRPVQGEARVCGEPVYGAGGEVRRRFGYLPEHNPLYPEMYVVEYLDFIARIYAVPRREERMREVVARTLLGEVLAKPVRALSRGFRQRLGLAAALLPDPEVLVLDEPLLQQDDRAILFSTHTIGEAEKIATRVLILCRGELRENRLVNSAEPAGLLEKQFRDLTR